VAKIEGKLHTAETGFTKNTRERTFLSSIPMQFERSSAVSQGPLPERIGTITLMSADKRHRGGEPEHMSPLSRKVEAASVLALIGALFMKVNGLINWASMVFGFTNGYEKTKFPFFLFKQLLVSLLVLVTMYLSLTVGFVPAYLALTLAKFSGITSGTYYIASTIVSVVTFVSSILAYGAGRLTRYFRDKRNRS
jgi:hypothetical protein